MKRFIPNPSGEFYDYKHHKIFIPDGNPICHNIMAKRYLTNPMDWEEWGKPTYVRLFVGLKTGRKTQTFPNIGTPIPEKFVRHFVRDIRTDQVGVKYGGTFVSQIGHWYDKDRKEFTEEPSLQIILYPAGEEDYNSFVKNIQYLTEALLDLLAQQSIIYELSNEGDIKTGEARWREN